MLENRDMMYGGYYQNIPGNMMYNNYGFQGPPGSLMPIMNNNMVDNNPLIDLNAKVNNLENRVKTLEQKINNSNNSYQDDNSMYML